MPPSLILAIESDHRQAWHLAQIARRLRAELVLAERFENALAAIGSHVPDLILVPALLSPEDDASLKFVLRVVSGAGHVQVVTTPLFGPASKPLARAMVLPRFLRGRDADTAQGCDPDEFARHVASYLQEAADKRADAQRAEEEALARSIAQLSLLFAQARVSSADVAADQSVAGAATHATPPDEEWGLFDPKRCGIEALIAKLRAAEDAG